MTWNILFHEDFEPEFDDFSADVQDEIISNISLLEKFGPTLDRPRVDTLNGSHYTNMKELQMNIDDGVWRVAFAFDPKREAILLVAGDKSGGSKKRFYKQFIKKADERFQSHLEKLNRKGK